MDSKPCAQCGCWFTKLVNCSRKRWTEQRKLCSVACRDAYLIGKPTWNKGLKGRQSWMNLSGLRRESGEKHWAWKGGVTTENHRIRTSTAYKAWRKTIFERDSYTCVWCGLKSAKGVKAVLQADHIKSFALYPELRLVLENGRTLCKPCHKKTPTFNRKLSSYTKT